MRTADGREVWLINADRRSGTIYDKEKRLREQKQKKKKQKFNNKEATTMQHERQQQQHNRLATAMVQLCIYGEGPFPSVHYFFLLMIGSDSSVSLRERDALTVKLNCDGFFLHWKNGCHRKLVKKSKKKIGKIGSLTLR